MIIGPGFIIATATKCGTHSWEALAKASPQLEILRPQQHRMIVPEEYADHDRYIAVRDPYDRLRSMWSFICHSTNRTQWGAKTTRGWSFQRWLEEWFLPKQAEAAALPYQARSPWVWTFTLTQNQHLVGCDLTPDGEVPAVRKMRHKVLPLKIEHATQEMQRLHDLYGFQMPRSDMYHSNRADMHMPSRGSAWTSKIIKLCDEAGARADAIAFRYPLLELGA